MANPYTTGPPVWRIILEQPFGPFRKVLVTLLILALGISVIFNIGLLGSYREYLQTDPNINEKLHSGSAAARDKIAVISLRGTIMQGDGFVKRQIDRVRKDENVKAVVLRVDSPGGTVTGSDYIYHHLKKLVEDRKIPLVVSMGSLAASGGYYVSMAVGPTEKTIYAEPTTWTGSIGVIIPRYDISKLLEHWKIEDDSIASGTYKQLLSPTRSLSKEERKIVEDLVTESFNGFKEVIAYGRPKLVKDEERWADVTTARIYTAKQAKDRGLVDELGFIEDAIERAAELANLKDEFKNDKVRVVKYERPLGVLDGMLGGRVSHSATNVGALLNLTAPRAWFLCTWLPAVAASNQP